MARRKRLINCSLFPENMGPQITSIQPKLPVMISIRSVQHGTLPARESRPSCYAHWLYGAVPAKTSQIPRPSRDDFSTYKLPANILFDERRIDFFWDLATPGARHRRF